MNIPLPEPDLTIMDERYWVWEKLRDHAAAVTAAARDCRTCSLFYDWEEGVCTQSNKDPCTNADRYEPLPPVRLWRTT